MRFVNDKDLEFVGGRGELRAVFKVAHFVYAAVGSGVYFHDIQCPAGINFQANAAIIARLAGPVKIRIQPALFAIGHFGDKPRRRRFSGAARAVKKIGVGNAVAFGGVADYLSDDFLAEQTLEIFGAVFSVNGGHETNYAQYPIKSFNFQ